MKNIIIACIIILSVLPLTSFGQPTREIFSNTLSPRNANYNINVELFPSTNMLKGKETITWTNITSKPTNELQFHLYLNGFLNNKSTILTESYGLNREKEKFRDVNKGFNKIISFKIGTQDLTNQLEFIQPDDNNPHDSTVVRVLLKEVVKSSETVQIEIVFVAKLPQIFARTGYSDPTVVDNFFLIGQWFPKIGVLEETGWNCHQYHANTEYFSDYGVYKVSITLPEKYVIGATGIQISKVASQSKKTVTYYAEDVHDFAWTAYPDFKVYVEKHKDISIRFLYTTETDDEIEKQVQSVRFALDYCQENFGNYPYSNITFLNPPQGASLAGGMEYPTFFTAGRNGLIPDNLLSIHLATTIHEVAHQFFQGIIGTNEFEHAWMDEGMTNYATQRVIDTYYGGHGNIGGFSFVSENRDRFKYLQNPNHESVLISTYKQKRSNYAVNSYARPATLLRTLEKFLGEEPFKNGMQYYYDKWKFKHPKPKDFFEAMNVGSKTNLSWFFDQFFRDNKTIDYEIYKISQQEERLGFINKNFQHFPNVDLSGNKPIYRNEVVIKNYGNGYFPMELELKLEDNSLWSFVKWDYKLNYFVLNFYSNSPILQAQLDPSRKAVIDLSYSNNGKSMNIKNAIGKYVSRWQFWVHNAIQFLGGF